MTATTECAAYDVAVIGAGPAGAATAARLAGRWRVLLIDRAPAPAPRIGEALIPAARAVLRDLGLLEVVERGGHAPWLGARSFWGGETAERRDFLADPHGPGWRLDRMRFEADLRAAALRRGATLIAPARLEGLTREAGRWVLSLAAKDGARTAAAACLIDAAGRAAPVARRLGARRGAPGRPLVAHWISAPAAPSAPSAVPVEAGFTTVEAAPDGWWYSAVAPAAGGARRLLAFHTDRDLAAAQPRGAAAEGAAVDGAAALAARASRLPALGPLLRADGFRPDRPLSRSAAHMARLTPAAGPGWLAIGDAALGFDPLASRGIFTALYTAMVGAMLVDEALMAGGGRRAPRLDVGAHEAEIARIAATTEAGLAHIYGAETRWPDQPFWARRRVGAPARALQDAPA